MERNGVKVFHIEFRAGEELEECLEYCVTEK